MNNLKKLIFVLMILFFGYITISSNIIMNNDEIEFTVDEEEGYIDDIPFDTKKIYDNYYNKK